VFNVKHTLDRKKYDEELTVTLKLNGREIDVVLQGKRQLSFSLNGATMLVNVQPFGKKISVKFK